MQADRKLQERAQRSKDAARRFAIISELCALGYDAQYLPTTQAIRVYNAPDGASCWNVKPLKTQAVLTMNSTAKRWGNIWTWHAQ
jgi:hypothetical protein